MRISLRLDLCESLVSSVWLSTPEVQNNFLFDVIMELFVAEILFLKHLAASVTQKAGWAMKTVRALGSNLGAALDSCVTLNKSCKFSQLLFLQL